MEHKSKFSRTVTFLKKWVGPKTWLYALGKENLGPKIGTGIAVYQVAGIIVKTMVENNPQGGAVKESAAQATMRQAEALVSMLDIMNSPWLAGALVFFSGLWFAAVVARGSFKFWKIRTAWFFKFGQFGPYFGVAAQFFMGMLVVPLVLTWAIILNVPDAFPASKLVEAAFITFGFVVLVIALHYFAFIEKELPNTVTYSIETPKTMRLPVSDHILTTLGDALDGITWVGAPEALSASDDGRIVISVPILYPAANWNAEDAAQLGARLQKAERTWLNDGCTILSRVIPDGIDRRLPNPLKLPLILPSVNARVRNGGKR